MGTICHKESGKAREGLNSAKAHANLLQRSCSDCPKKRKLLQRRAVRQSGPVAVPPIVHEVLRSPGRPLDAATRGFMESRFSHEFSQVKPQAAPQAASLTIGLANDSYEQEADRVADSVMQSKPSQKASLNTRYDFSQVRVHDDARAAESARAVNALAYTVSRDIVFGMNQDNSRSQGGKRLLAHELAHIVQQEHGANLIQRQVGSSPDECGERGPADSEGHPLIYNCQDANNLGRPEQESCKRPAVGHAQQLLNEFLRRYDNWKSGVDGDTIACAGGGSAQIETLRNSLPSQLKIDCWFGDLTYRATRMFQLCDGGLKVDGKIGEKTWPRLEDLAGGQPPKKQPPAKKPPVGIETKVNKHNQDRKSTLIVAISILNSLAKAIDSGITKGDWIDQVFAAPLSAMKTWLKASRSDPDFRSTLTQTTGILSNNLNANAPVGMPPNSDSICSTPPCILNGFGCSRGYVDVNICHGWEPMGDNCRTGVLLHEFNHFIGIHKEAGDRASIKKPADAFDNADSMAQFVLELNGRPTDCCAKTC